MYVTGFVNQQMQEYVLIGGEKSGGISFKGLIPEGDGILMGFLLSEIVADSGVTLVDGVRSSDTFPTLTETAKN
ncbi:MAG: hypothetical protein WCG34_10810 [Leptolinea sp.]